MSECVSEPQARYMTEAYKEPTETKSDFQYNTDAGITVIWRNQTLLNVEV